MTIFIHGVKKNNHCESDMPLFGMSLKITATDPFSLSIKLSQYFRFAIACTLYRKYFNPVPSNLQCKQHKRRKSNLCNISGTTLWPLSFSSLEFTYNCKRPSNFFSYIFEIQTISVVSKALQIRGVIVKNWYDFSFTSNLFLFDMIHCPYSIIMPY